MTQNASMADLYRAIHRYFTRKSRTGFKGKLDRWTYVESIEDAARRAGREVKVSQDIVFVYGEGGVSTFRKSPYEAMADRLADKDQ